MPISVDLPSRFSPIMPWMLPRPTVSETPALACTAPNHLSMATASRAGAAGSVIVPLPSPSSWPGLTGPSLSWPQQTMPRSSRGMTISSSLRHVVGHLDLARDDVLAGVFQLLFHVRRDQRPVVL